MKKIFAILLASLMVLGLFAGCGAAEEAPAAEESKNIKIGFIFLHDENSTYDKNFI